MTKLPINLIDLLRQRTVGLESCAPRPPTTA
jgi:hypothetical protein